MGARFRRRVSGFLFRGGRPTVRQVGGAFLSFVILAASGGSRVMRAHSSPRPLDHTPRHLPPRPPLPFVVFVFFRNSTQRESSPARAHDTIGAGRVKRLLGARVRRRVSGFFFRGGRRTVHHVGRACLVFLAPAASGGARVMRAHSAPRPLDHTPRHPPPRPPLSFVVFVFFLIPPNRCASAAALHDRTQRRRLQALVGRLYQCYPRSHDHQSTCPCRTVDRR